MITCHPRSRPGDSTGPARISRGTMRSRAVPCPHSAPGRPERHLGRAGSSQPPCLRRLAAARRLACIPRSGAAHTWRARVRRQRRGAGVHVMLHVRRAARHAAAVAGITAAAVFDPQAAFAAAGPQILAADSIAQVVSNLTAWIIGILAGVATLFLTIGGLRYLAAGGDPAEVEKAKGALRSAAIGYGLAILAPVIVGVLKSLVGALRLDDVERGHLFALARPSHTQHRATPRNACDLACTRCWIPWATSPL
jgi:type IV secretion system pilin